MGRTMPIRMMPRRESWPRTISRRTWQARHSTDRQTGDPSKRSASASVSRGVSRRNERRRSDWSPASEVLLPATANGNLFLPKKPEQQLSSDGKEPGASMILFPIRPDKQKDLQDGWRGSASGKKILKSTLSAPRGKEDRK